MRKVDKIKKKKSEFKEMILMFLYIIKVGVISYICYLFWTKICCEIFGTFGSIFNSFKK